MADRPQIDDERLEQAMAYHGGALSPEETVEFEAHLRTCPGCHESLRFAEQLLAFKPKRTIDEQVARFEALVAAKRADAAIRTPRSRGRIWFVLAVTAALAVAATLAVLRVAPRVSHPDEVDALTKPGNAEQRGP